MGILFCPQKYCTIGWDPVLWSSRRKAGDLSWIQQIAPSDAAAGFLWIGESVLEQARWFLHAGGVTKYLFKLDWSVWSVNPFWNKMIPAQVRFQQCCFLTFLRKLVSLNESWHRKCHSRASLLREHLFTGLLSSMCWASFAEVGTQDELIENIHVWHHIPKILC